MHAVTRLCVASLFRTKPIRAKSGDDEEETFIGVKTTGATQPKTQSQQPLAQQDDQDFDPLEAFMQGVFFYLSFLQTLSVIACFA